MGGGSILAITIILALVITGLIAYLIVKYLPSKLNPLISIVLLVVAGFLAYQIYDNIMEPIRFEKAKKEKFAAVIAKLKLIRDVQVDHRTVNGDFIKDKDSLIRFIKEGKRAITRDTNVIVLKELSGGLTDNVEQKRTDTIGYEPVAEKFKGRDIDNMFKVPNSTEEFNIQLGEVEKYGVMNTVFKIAYPKAKILKGMNEELVKVELKATAQDKIVGEEISVGSLDEVNTAGNWPPSYDFLTKL